MSKLAIEKIITQLNNKYHRHTFQPQFRLLCQSQEDIPTIAHWYYQQWGQDNGALPLDQQEAKLYDYCNDDKTPLMLLAYSKENIIASAQLKYQEMTIYPEYKHFLGAVYVANSHRGQNMASALIDGILRIAKQLDVKTLYLQTEHLDGGLYKKLGWIGMHQAFYQGVNVLVMKRNL